MSNLNLDELPRSHVLTLQEASEHLGTSPQGLVLAGCPTFRLGSSQKRVRAGDLLDFIEQRLADERERREGK